MRLARVTTTVAALCLSSAAAAQQFVDQTSTRFPSPNPAEYTNQLTIGDIDGDGDLDIIFGNGAGYASADPPQRMRVYINDGSGVFTDESFARTGGYSGIVRGVELGDMDGDDDLDMITAQDFNRQPSLLENDGGVYTDVTGQLPAMTLSSSRAQFGDIENDGDLDIFITSGSTSRFTCGQYRVYVNDGAGNYTDETATRMPIVNVCNNMDCIFGDIDGDFDLDVRTASTGTNNSRLYRNDGTGVFSIVAGVPSDSSCYSYDFGDMDGDGDLDLLGVNGGSGSSEILLKNDGAGAYTNVSGQISPNPSQDDNDSKFFDYDADGDLDLLIGRLGSGGEKIYNNDGTGLFTQVSGAITVISDSTLDIMVADLDNDGDLDIVTAQGESGAFQNRIYMNVTGTPDVTDPRIIDTEQLPDTADTAGPYVVRAAILDDMSSDRNFFDKGIELNYSVGAGPVQQVPMRHSGGQIYRGEIPGQPGGGLVEYFVTATDWADNTGTGDTLSFTVTGASCPWDCDGSDDGIVGVDDFLAVLAQWGMSATSCHFAGGGAVGIDEFLDILAHWGNCP